MAYFKVSSRHSLGETEKTQIILVHVRSKAVTAVIMKSSIIWDVTPCNLVEVSNVSEKRTASFFREEYANQAYASACWFSRFTR
jgi:hypothetical protein